MSSRQTRATRTTGSSPPTSTTLASSPPPTRAARGFSVDGIIDLCSDSVAGCDGDVTSPASPTPGGRAAWSRSARSGGFIDLCSNSDDGSGGDVISPTTGGGEHFARSGDVVDLCSESSDDEDSDFPSEAPSPQQPSTPPQQPTTPPATLTPSKRRRPRRKQSEKRLDWDADDVHFRDLTSATFIVYVLCSKGRVYTGSSSRNPEDVVRAHNAGTRWSTKGRGPWTLAFHVGPFRNRQAAARFESLVKKRGSSRGVEPKAAAAHRALRAASPGLAEEDGVRVQWHSPQTPRRRTSLRTTSAV
mmetsp:Transcript_21869/g.67304  ORF Transcript_21869/g.67304 Transcript_21869/m.67304 type:complete len:302 (-) Transcript_21869:69-974(-)